MANIANSYEAPSVAASHAVAQSKQPAALIGWLRDTLAAYRQRRRDREAFVELLQYDERLLNDMGLTRGAVARAAHLPLSANATTIAIEQSRVELGVSARIWRETDVRRM